MILRGLPEGLLGMVSFSLIVSFNPLKSPKKGLICNSLIINDLENSLLSINVLCIINKNI